MKIISDLRKAIWAMVQVVISNLNYDFVGYGQPARTFSVRSRTRLIIGR